MPIRATLFTLAAASLALAACDRSPSEAELAKLDNQLVGNEADPALTNALEDQILVDPALNQQSNKMAARAPSSAPQAQYPVTDKGQAAGAGAAAGGATAPMQQAAAVTGACGGKFEYGANWAKRLPTNFAVYPGARITEAAGNAGDCRVVIFASADAPQRVLDWYRGRAAQAGYSPEQQVRGSDLVLGGANRGAGAFFLIVTPKAKGAEGALIVNQGR
jgi:hypothetical protein